ncbi:hypothetical protein BaRGS_00002981 [Batillaria attramentaria]|uniref:Uncharacterized protein n=1 Tax=Batillaria attramentaria TaxID=370345 RepID=A0ABD0M2D4_9CAEN
MDLRTSMKRQDSASCLLLLDSEADSCDVFDPPAWRPGRYLQFADITSAEDEASVRPVSLPTGRLPLGVGPADHTREEGGVGTSSEVHLDLVQMLERPSRSTKKESVPTHLDQAEAIGGLVHYREGQLFCLPAVCLWASLHWDFYHLSYDITDITVVSDVCWELCSQSVSLGCLLVKLTLD